MKAKYIEICMRIMQIDIKTSIIINNNYDDNDRKYKIIKSYLKLNNIIDFVKFKKGGKPFLKNNSFYFNKTHNKDYVIYALSSNNVGVDIEKISGFNIMLTKRIFTEEEIRKIKKVKNHKFLLCLFWTIKEAYCKYTGKGLIQILSGDITIRFTNKYCGNVNNVNFFSTIYKGNIITTVYENC